MTDNKLAPREESIQKALDDAKTGVVKGLPVHGYKPQSLEAVTMVNKNKELEETLLRVCDSMRVGRNEHSPFDQRWLSIAVTHFEQGFMALNRAVFQPGRIKLPHDSLPAPKVNELPEGMTEGDVRG